MSISPEVRWWDHRVRLSLYLGNRTAVGWQGSSGCEKNSLFGKKSNTTNHNFEVTSGKRTLRHPMTTTQSYGQQENQSFGVAALPWLRKHPRPHSYHWTVSLCTSTSLPFCKELTDCCRMPHRPSSKANSRKMSPVTGTFEHRRPNSIRTPEISTIK